jgi:hypothetical protein
MSRSPILVSLLAIVALFAAVPVATSSVARHQPLPAEIDFELPANNGLRAHVENSSEGITLILERKGYYASYKVDGEATEAGVKAQFGMLGRIDVTFEPTETELDGPKGCKGPPSRLSQGRFVGTIEFTGEQEYVRIATSEVEGMLNVWRESEWHCPRRKPSANRPAGQRTANVLTFKRPHPKKEPASLVALDHPCRCFFAAFAERTRRGRGWTDFVGAKFEEREGMEISRVLSAPARPADFVFDHARGTARVSPPPPFSGHATFRRRPHARDLWRSTIRFPLLGSDPLGIRGPGVRARLVRELPGGE